MARIFQSAAVLAMLVLSSAAQAQSHNAQVIGNAAYETAPALKTPLTDAAIVAETLRAAGYDVTELQNIRQAEIGLVMRDFLDKTAQAGPDGVAFVYYSGYGARVGKDNYLVPVDAVINDEADVDNEAFRLNDLLTALIETPLGARIVVLDAARDHNFGGAGKKPLAKGLAASEPVPGLLLAYAAAPGALAQDGDTDYSLYTGALVTAMRQPGVDIEQMLKEARVQVNQATAGAQTPWSTSGLTVNVTLFAPAEPEPAPPQADKPAPKPAAKTGSRTRTVRPPTDADVIPAHPSAPPLIIPIPGGIGIGRGGFGIEFGR